MPEARAEIGIVGGSGFYELLRDADELRIDTPFGTPSDAVTVGEVGGRRVAFLPRHGRGHRLPPHRIDFRANLWALHSLGISRLISPSAVGSLQAELPPGTFVLLDQLVNRTWGRPDTFFDGPDAPDGFRTVTHVSLADPYCPQLRRLAAERCAELGLEHREHGTCVVIQGPRFSTRAESRWYSAAGWDTIGMTQYPEVALARELQLCTLGVALVTDYDVGLAGRPEVEAVSSAAVLETFRANLTMLTRLLDALVPTVPAERTCPCGSALAGAQL